MWCGCTRLHLLLGLYIPCSPCFQYSLWKISNDVRVEAVRFGKMELFANLCRMATGDFVHIPCGYVLLDRGSRCSICHPFLQIRLIIYHKCRPSRRSQQLLHVLRDPLRVYHGGMKMEAGQAGGNNAIMFKPFSTNFATTHGFKNTAPLLTWSSCSGLPVDFSLVDHPRRPILRNPISLDESNHVRMDYLLENLYCIR